MKYRLSVVLLLLLSSLAFAQQPTNEVQTLLDSAKTHQKDDSYVSYLEKAVVIATEKSDIYGNALVHQRLGSYYYTRNPLKSVEYQRVAFDYFIQANAMPMAAICLHNIGFTYEEQLHDISAAIKYIDQAIQLHEQLHDTMELANMYKYLGMLKSKMHNYTEAKQLINKAVLFFEYKNYEPGIAVSWFDLALVYAEQKKADSAIFYALKAKAYWYTNNGTARIVGINNELVKWYLILSDENEVHNLLLENETMVNDSAVYWKEKLGYYFIAYKYYSQVKHQCTAQQYLAKYNALRNDLRTKGFKTE